MLLFVTGLGLIKNSINMFSTQKSLECLFLSREYFWPRADPEPFQLSTGAVANTSDAMPLPLSTSAKVLMRELSNVNEDPIEGENLDLDG